MILEDFSLSLAAPLETAQGELTQRHGTLIGVDRERGGRSIRGVGEATPLPGWTESLETCRDTLRSHAADPPGEVFATLAAKSGHPESTPAARHGIALATLDAAARSEGISLASYLADRTAAVAEAVPVNATIGIGTPAETAAQAERAVASGYDCLKLKAGSGALELDVQRVRAVREAVGDDVEIRVDANGSWTEGSARRAIERLAALDVAYVEQPVSAQKLAATADLRGRGVDIAVDETLTEYRIEDVLDADAADVVVLKPMALGGPDRAREIALLARRAGVSVVVTTTVDAVVARTAAVHLAASIPEVRACGLATGELLAEDLASDPAPVEDGAIEVPTGPGIAGDAFETLFE